MSTSGRLVCRCVCVCVCVCVCPDATDLRAAVLAALVATILFGYTRERTVPTHRLDFELADEVLLY